MTRSWSTELDRHLDSGPDRGDQPNPDMPSWIGVLILAITFLAVATSLVIGQQLQDHRLREQCQRLNATSTLVADCQRAVDGSRRP